jgi:hypothetical protein
MCLPQKADSVNVNGTSEGVVQAKCRRRRGRDKMYVTRQGFGRYTPPQPNYEHHMLLLVYDVCLDYVAQRPSLAKVSAMAR